MIPAVPPDAGRKHGAAPIALRPGGYLRDVHTQQARPAISRTLEIAGWSLAGFGFWVVTLSSPTLPEVFCAAAAALPCAVLARVMRTTLGDAWIVPTRRWALLPVVVLLRAIAETGPIMRASLQQRRGRMRRRELPPGPDGPSASRAALLMLCSSATPGRIVVHVDDGLRRFVLHELLSGGDRIEEVLTDGNASHR